MESTAATPQLHELVLRARNLDRAGFAHGFSVRADAEGGAHTLDFGATASADARAESVRRFAEIVGFAPEDLRQVHQVHGARVVRATDVHELAPHERGPREE